MEAWSLRKPHPSTVGSSRAWLRFHSQRFLKKTCQRFRMPSCVVRWESSCELWYEQHAAVFAVQPSAKPTADRYCENENEIKNPWMLEMDILKENHRAIKFSWKIVLVFWSDTVIPFKRPLR